MPDPKHGEGAKTSRSIVSSLKCLDVFLRESATC